LMKRAAIVVMVAALAACSSNPNEHKPAPLPVLPQKAMQLKLHKQWSANVGDGLSGDVIKLHAATQANLTYIASRDGVVLALDEQGKTVWQQKTKLPITSGISAGYGVVVIATAKGEVLALNPANGQTLWRKPLLAPVLAPAALSAETIIIQSNDGKVYGLDSKTGEKRWVYDTPVPSLSLRGYATPLIDENLVIVATATGKIVALDVNTGIAQWESRIATSEGRSELARMVDVDGDMLLTINKDLYVASYQGQLAALNIKDKPDPLWTVPTSTTQSLAEGLGNVYVVDAASSIISVDQETGKVVWKQSDFSWRGLSNPVVLGNYLVVGDSSGYLHIMAQSDGSLLGRERVSGAVITLAATENALTVYSAKGQFSRWQLP
jgi:outer membrane protein assembly factor BamB